jgi:signal transduction histidine kinase
MKYWLFIVIPFFLAFQKGHTQAFTIYNHSILEGLPSAEVYDVFQDSKGFLWFATDNGVARYDGSYMESFHIKNGLSDPVVFGFFEDAKKRVWFRSFSGKLSYYQNGKIHRYAYNDDVARINQRGFIQFVIRANDELVFTTSNAIARIDADGKVLTTTMDSTGLYHVRIDSTFILGAAAKNNDPIASITIDGKRFKLDLSQVDYINYVHRWVDWRGVSLFNLNNDIFCYDGNNVFKVKSCGSPVISMSLDREDNLWVGYLNGGVERFQNPKLIESWTPEFLKDKSVTKVLQDHEGGFWFTTLENGVYQVPNMQLEHHELSGKFKVRGVVQNNKSILLGDLKGNLYKLDKATKKDALLMSLEPPITAMRQLGRSKFFISTNANIHILNEDFKIVQVERGIATDISEDKEGNVWTYGGNRLRKFQPNGKVEVSKSLEFPYRAMLNDNDMFFLANRTGLHLRDTALKKIDQPAAFNDFKISAITRLNDSTLLFSTIGSGFLLVNKRTLAYRVYNSQNNFIADNIYAVLIDYSDLWLGTEKGLIKIPISSLSEASLTFDYVSKRTGLISDKIDYLVMVDRDLWVFSENSFSLLPLTFEKFASKKPIFYIREIKVNNLPTEENSLAVLQHGQNNIHLAIGFIAFNNQNIYLRYRLNKTDAWVYPNDKTLQFSSLSPGRYSLELQYSADRIQWNSAQTIPMNILKPWWNEWYVSAGVAAILIMLIILYLRYQQSIYNQKNHYLRIINEHQQKLIQSEIVTLERERNRISKELHDRVGTNLTAIKHTVSRILQTHKDPNAAEVEQQFQMAIQEIKEIIYALTPPSLERYGLFTSLKNYVGKLNKSIPINISLKTFGQEVGGGNLNIILFRVIQELLNNSIKHSFANNITIHINAFEDVINIVYEDDGIGFSYDPLQSGLGLDNIESRIHSVNGTLKFDSGKFGISYSIDVPLSINKEVV